MRTPEVFSFKNKGINPLEYKPEPVAERFIDFQVANYDLMLDGSEQDPQLGAPVSNSREMSGEECYLFLSIGETIAVNGIPGLDSVAEMAKEDIYNVHSNGTALGAYLQNSMFGLARFYGNTLKRHDYTAERRAELVGELVLRLVRNTQGFLNRPQITPPGEVAIAPTPNL